MGKAPRLSCPGTPAPRPVPPRREGDAGCSHWLRSRARAGSVRRGGPGTVPIGCEERRVRRGRSFSGLPRASQGARPRSATRRPSRRDRVRAGLRGVCLPWPFHSLLLFRSFTPSVLVLSGRLLCARPWGLNGDGAPSAVGSHPPGPAGHCVVVVRAVAAVPGVGTAGKIPGPPGLRVPEAFRRRCRRQPASVQKEAR